MAGKPQQRKAQRQGDTPPQPKAKVLTASTAPRDLTRVSEDVVDRYLAHYGHAPNAFDGLAAKVGVLADQFRTLEHIAHCDLCGHGSDLTLPECPFCGDGSPVNDTRSSEPPRPSPPTEGDDAPNEDNDALGDGVEVTYDDEALVRDTLERLVQHPVLFQRGGQLVTVAEVVDKRISKTDRKRRVVPLTINSLREAISAVTYFYTVSEKDGAQQCATPARLMGMLLDRGSYPDTIKPLMGITPCPIVRTDGTVVTEPGYDEESGLFWGGQGRDVKLVARPAYHDAVEALAMLRQVVSDFPFEGEEHFSGWLALVLTLTGRHLIHGCTPLFAVDGTTRGVGKGLLVDAASLIVTGESLARLPEPTDDAETRKLITAIAIAGDPSALLDNVERPLVSPQLAAVNTALQWSDRVLGGSTRVSLPWRCVLIATGNNIQFSSDIARRTLHIRLASPLENPEERTDLTHSDLRAHIRTHRSELLGAALNILRAYLLAGSPIVTEQTWGSFEGWSRVIRQAVVWCGGVDPLVTRQALAARDSEAVALRNLLAALADLQRDKGRGLTSTELIEAAEATDSFDPTTMAVQESLHEALCTLCPLPPGKHLTSATLGYRLRRYVGRVVGGQMLASDRSKLGAIWSTHIQE